MMRAVHWLRLRRRVEYRVPDGGRRWRACGLNRNDGPRSPVNFPHRPIWLRSALADHVRTQSARTMRYCNPRRYHLWFGSYRIVECIGKPNMARARPIGYCVPPNELIRDLLRQN